MMRLEIKNYNTILTEKQQKYQHYHLEKFINMNILQVIKYYHLIKEELQNKLSLYLLQQEKLQKNKQTNTIEDQGKKQIKAIEDHGKQLVESNAHVKKMIMVLKIYCI